MRLATLLVLFLILPLFSYSQYHTEFGIDIISPIILASGANARPTQLELIYKEDTGEKDLRFKFFITSNFDDFELVRRVDIDSSQFYNYAVPTRTYGINIGVAPHFKVQGLHLYYGFDANIALNESYTAVMTSACDPLEDLPLCDQVRSLDNNHYTLGIIPFLGGKLDITERLLLTIEFGTELAFFLGNHNYYAGNDIIKKQKINFFAPQFDRLLNDIAISYRF
jgi:hypothetical protein